MKIVAIREVMSGSSSSATVFQLVMQHGQKQFARFLDPYRPERHYMRGPGPRCREKQGL